MEHVLVMHLILGIISSGQIHKVMPERMNDSQKCHTKCPAGYYVRSPCEGSSGYYTCEKCDKGTFTAIENTHDECFRCTPCPFLQVETEECLFNRDRKCDCKQGYYVKDSECIKCDFCSAPDDLECKCRQCLRKSCLNNTECQRKCEVYSKQISTPATATSTSTSTPHVIRYKEENNLILWILVVAPAVLVVWLLLLFTIKILSYCCLSWSANKNLSFEHQERHKEQHSHQDSSLTTVTIKVCKETPRMPLSSNTASGPHPTITSAFLQDTDQAAAGHGELTDEWPAVVLYTIIKAVPLRRWREFLRLLSVADHEMERVEMDIGLGQSFMEKQYQILRLWSQRSSADMGEVFSALRNMDLSGCAEMLEERLKKLPWRSELDQALLTCKGSTDCGLSGSMQDTVVSEL